MIYKTLYKRSVTGKVSTWYVETNNECFRTVSGFEDGQKVTEADYIKFLEKTISTQKVHLPKQKYQIRR